MADPDSPECVRRGAETLYNSIFVYDDEMLINHHIYGMYGYMPGPWGIPVAAG